MRRFIVGFLAGVVLGVLLRLGPVPVADSPWPEPTPILAVVDVEGLERAECEARMAELAIKCNILYTGTPNPPEAWVPRLGTLERKVQP